MTKARVANVKEKAATRGKKVKTWPPPGGSIDEIAGLLTEGVRRIGAGYHAGEFRQKLAVRTMALGLFDRAAEALDGSVGWAAAWDPWWSAYARGEVVVTALVGRIAGAAALTEAQRGVLRRWLVEGEAALADIGPTWTACRPQALLGAGWLLLGEQARGDRLLAAAVAGVDPESNTTEHRAVIAHAYAALGRVREAIEVLTSREAVSWTYAAPAVAEVVRRASADELERLRSRLAGVGAHREFVLFDRGLARLIALKEWAAAKSWLAGFEGLATRDGEAQLIAAMVAAGEATWIEASRSLVDPQQSRGVEVLLALARVSPDLARGHLERRFADAPALLVRAANVGQHLRALAGAAARCGRLDVAERVEALGRDAGEMQAARLGVLAELDPSDAAWAAWFSRARPGATSEEKAELAALAVRAGSPDAAALLDEAIAAARASIFPDDALEQLSGRLVGVGDMTAAHRVWLTIAKGKRPNRSRPLLAGCVAAEAWAGALELLRAMPQDLGAPQRASQLLLGLADGEGL